MKGVLVAGLGNPLMSDEGIGVHVIHALAREQLPDDVRLLELGTGGLAVVHALAGCSRAVFVDCAFMGEPPGTLRRFAPGDVRDLRRLPRHSAHEGNLLDLLELARAVGTAPEDVVIFGIEPADLSPGRGPSRALRERLSYYVAAVRAEVASARSST